MKICRIRSRRTQRLHLTVLEGDSFRLLEGDPERAMNPDAGSFSPEDVEILAPVTPSKILAIGRNYAAHARELGNVVGEIPLMFSKPPSSVIGPGQTIVLPPESERVDHEGELAIVIGKRCRRVSSEKWREVVLGFTCANDVTARDIQKRDVQFTRGKGFDTFCPIGPWIETELDPMDVRVSTRVNGELRQDGRTSDLAFSIPYLVEFVSASMTLEPGDLILTGTPEGVGPLSEGDLVEVEVEGIGTLLNRVAKEISSGD